MIEDEHITMSFDDFLIKTINKKNANFFIEHLILKTKQISNEFRGEIKFFDSLENIVNSESKEINLIRQYKVLKYKIDAVIIEDIKNYGNFENIDKDVLKSIILFEYDENHHNKTTDSKRMEKIINELLNNFDLIKLFRIPEDKAFEFLKYAIPYFSRTETSYSFDRMELFKIYTNY